MRTIHLAVCLASACLLLLAPPAAQGAGLAYSDNFIVLAPDQPLADEVLSAAEGLRKEIALKWLGAELPAGKGQTCVSVKVSDTEDRGLSWLIDHPQRTLHNIWLRTSRSGALGTTLAHEVTHVVLGTHFGERLPAWADEGAASLEDDPQRAALRSRILASYAGRGDWPDIARVLDAPLIRTGDQTTYAVAVSLTEYLLTRGDKARLLRFAVEGNQHGYAKALRENYGIRSLADLQSAWEAWAGQTSRARPLAARADRLTGQTTVARR